MLAWDHAEGVTVRQTTSIPPCPPPPVSMQHGSIAMPMMVSVLVLGASMLALQAAKQTRRPLAEQRTTEQRLDRIEQALRAYVMTHRQLPCPADGKLDTGLASPILGAGPCPSPPGDTVPWATLGLQKDDALDAWSRKISYRVRAGNTSLIPAPPSPSPSPSPSPLNVRDDYVGPPVIPDIAWVLISHGPTGYGAWLLKGDSPLDAKRMMPLPSDIAAPTSGPDEYSNTQSDPTTVFVKKPFNIVDLLPTQAAFFDDVVRYKTLAKLKAEAGLLAVAPGTPSVPFTAATLATSGVTFTGFSSGQQTLIIPASGGTPGLTLAVQPGQQIAFDNTGSPKSGVGVCNSSGPCNATNAELSGAETLSFKLVDATAYKLGVALKNFTPSETAQITFKLNGVQVGAVVSYTGFSNAIDLTPTVASAAFDEVVIGAGGASSFFIDAVRFCDASTSCVP